MIVLAGELESDRLGLLGTGIGAGLGVAGPVISPTFVLSRIHPAVAAGPSLVHVDAYRLGYDVSRQPRVEMPAYTGPLPQQATSVR